MKKILGAALSFALLLAGTTVFADEANTVQTPTLSSEVGSYSFNFSTKTRTRHETEYVGEDAITTVEFDSEIPDEIGYTEVVLDEGDYIAIDENMTNGRSIAQIYTSDGIVKGYIDVPVILTENGDRVEGYNLVDGDKVIHCFDNAEGVSGRGSVLATVTRSWTYYFSVASYQDRNTPVAGHPDYRDYYMMPRKANFQTDQSTGLDVEVSSWNAINARMRSLSSGDANRWINNINVLRTQYSCHYYFDRNFKEGMWNLEHDRGNYSLSYYISHKCNP